MGSLEPKHLQEFLKKLRSAIAPKRLRYFAVGEYGEKTHRAHYHLILFGYPVCSRGRTYRRPGYSQPLWERCCPSCNLVGKTWGKGDIDQGIVEDASARYVAGYVQKKMTHASDPRLMPGRHPEFARMSLKPGIGREFMHEVASTFLQYDADAIDVPSTLDHGGKSWPLGQYLRRELRKMVGRDVKTPPEALAIIDEEMRELRETAFDNSTSIKEEVTKKFEGKRLSILARDKLHTQRKEKL